MFPTINNIDDVRPHLIEGFYETEKDGFTVVDYHILSDVPKESFSPLMECRGIKFCSKTGNILARPLHKFFNHHELDVDVSAPRLYQDFMVYPKHDGSMVHTILIDGELYLHTRAGYSDQAKAAHKFLQTNQQLSDYLKRESETKTFIFEYVAPDNRIVVEYAEPALIPLAVRDNVTGEYLDTNDTMHLLSRGHCMLPKESIRPEKSIDQMGEEEDHEGYVFVWPDGFRMKVKTKWYCQIHKVLAGLSQPKDVLRLIIENKVDDVSEFLTNDQINKLELIRERLINTADFFFNELSNEAKKCETRKDFFTSKKVQGLIKKHGFVSRFCAWIWEDGKSNQSRVTFCKCLEGYTTRNKKAEQLECFLGKLSIMTTENFE